MKKLSLLTGLLFTLYSTSILADDAFLRDEVAQLKDDMVILQRQLYREKNDTTVPQESVSTFQIRLGEFDQLIREMNGKIENIEYRLNTLEKKLEVIDKDIDLRFSQLKKQNGGISAPRKETNVNQPVKAPAGTNAKDLYENALTDLKNNKLSDAETKLTQFLSSFPQDALAGNAQYWLGEVYYKQQNFAKAAVAFKDGYSKYPEGSKGPDCLLKLGLSMKALGKKQEACTAFTNLPSMFGKVNPEISARSKKEAEALACK